MFQFRYTTGFIVGAWLFSPAAAAEPKPASLTAGVAGSRIVHTWDLCSKSVTKRSSRALPDSGGYFYTYNGATDLEKMKDGIENPNMLFPDDWTPKRDRDGTIVGFNYAGWEIPPLKYQFLMKYFTRRDAAVGRPQRAANRVEDTLRETLFEMGLGDMEAQWVDDIGHLIVEYLTAAKRKRRGGSSGSPREKTSKTPDWGAIVAKRLHSMQKAAHNFHKKSRDRHHRRRRSRAARDVKPKYLPN